MKEFPFRATLPIFEDCFSDFFIVVMQQALTEANSGTPNTKIRLHREIITCTFPQKINFLLSSESCSKRSLDDMPDTGRRKKNFGRVLFFYAEFTIYVKKNAHECYFTSN